MPLRALLLDVGNTLVQEQPPRSNIYAEAARRRGVAVEPGAMRALMARVHHELPRVVAGGFRYSDPWFSAFIERIFREGLGFSPEAVADITAELFERFESPATFRVLPGALELLETARARGLSIGVVSNWSARLPRLLRALDLSQRLDFVLCSALEGLEKPDPAFFHAALARAGVPAASALHAGDDFELDVAGARAAGIEAVLVDHAGGNGAASARAAAEGVRRVTSLEALIPIILERAA